MGSTRDDLMRDISAVTGVEYITKAQGRKFSEIEPNLSGGASKVIVSKNDTKIVGGFGTEEQIAQRKEELEENLKQAKNKKWLKSRISMLEGGVARIIVGGKTTSDMKERYDRVEDAVLATQSAAEEGYVAGGGSTFRHIALNEKKAFNASGYNPDFIKGYNLVLEACIEPENTILKNAGQVHEETFLDRLFPPKQTEQQEYGYGFDAKEYETKVDLIARGIIDPAKVLDRCLRNASTNAITLLKTDFLIFDK
jgi:chaperonin GroEL